MSADLLFTRAATGSTDLLFGASDAPTVAPMPVRLALDTGAPSLALRLARATPATMVVMDVTGSPLVAMSAQWDSNTYRVQALGAKSPWQLAERPIPATAAALWQTSRPQRLASALRWQSALGAQAATVCAWANATRYLRPADVHWQQGRASNSCAAPRWQGARPLFCMPHARHQAGTRSSSGRTLRWQGARPLRMQPSVRWQPTSQVTGDWQAGFGPGLAAFIHTKTRWQLARMALPGISQRPVVVTPWDGCYWPPKGDAVHLLFGQAAHNTPALLFACRGVRAPGDALVVIERLSMYTHISEVHATLWPEGDALPLFECSIETDAGGYGWHLRASGQAQLMEMLAPRADGTPVRVRVEICGMAWVFVVGLRQRSRQFGRHVVTFAAASATSLLDAPHVQPGTFANTAQQTAQQLAAAALEYTGVTLDWRIDDWLVPAGVWSHQGTPLSAVLRVADAAGAIVQSHRTADTLIVQPRYAAMPWEWAQTPPALQLPIGYCTLESMDEERAQPYNAVYTSGTIAGLVRRTKRAGTAGDIEAQAVSDPLLTASAAHVQRARSILGAGGWQANVGLTLPFDNAPGAPGLLDVGTLIEIADPGGNWRGLVRGVGIRAGARPGVRQSVKVERHLHTEAA